VLRFRSFLCGSEKRPPRSPGRLSSPPTLSVRSGRAGLILSEAALRPHDFSPYFSLPLELSPGHVLLFKILSGRGSGRLLETAMADSKGPSVPCAARARATRVVNLNAFYVLRPRLFLFSPTTSWPPTAFPRSYHVAQDTRRSFSIPNGRRGRDTPPTENRRMAELV